MIASGLNVPWGIAFLPNGDALVSERATGRIKRIPKNGGTPRTVKTIPGVAKNFGEGGLLGIAVSPTYSRDRLVYAYYTSSRDNRVVRFQLGGRSRTSSPASTARATTTAAGSPSAPTASSTSAPATPATGRRSQDRSSLNGKILRVNPDGSVPSRQPVRLAGLVARPPQRAGPELGQLGPPVGDGVRPGHQGRGQPHREGQQLRLAQRRGRRRHAGRQVHQPARHVEPVGGLAER